MWILFAYGVDYFLTVKTPNGSERNVELQQIVVKGILVIFFFFL